MSLYKQLDKLLQKQMTRRQFLATLGLGLVSIFGFSAVLKMLGGKTLALENEAAVSTATSYKQSDKILIKNGFVVTMDGQLGDVAGGDVLVGKDKIVKVGSNLGHVWGAETIDARGMIVMPGLMDNHRHMWQGLIRGVAVDQTFGQYFADVLLNIRFKYTPDDIYLGDLLSAYEAIESGVTTILDWSHANMTHEHALAAIEALEDSKMRAVYGYAAATDDGPPHAEDLQDALNRTRHNPLLSLAVGTNSPETRPDAKARFYADIAAARGLGLPITMHAGFAATDRAGRPSIAQELNDQGLLRDDMTFVHVNAYTADEFKMIADAGAHVSSSPEIEMQMGFGPSPLGRLLQGGIKPTLSLDVPSGIPGNMFAQLRFMLQEQRLLDHQEALAGGAPLPELKHKLGDSLPFVTTNTAASLKLDHLAGSLTPGKQADIIMIHHTDLNTFLGKPRDMVVQAHPGNVDTVMVAGRILKRHRRLVGVDLDKLRAKAEKANKRLLQNM